MYKVNKESYQSMIFRTETVTAAIMVVVVLTLMISTTTGFADSGGNNGQ